MNNPIVSEELACERELGNSHDPEFFKITCNLFYMTFGKVQNFGG